MSFAIICFLRLHTGIIQARNILRTRFGCFFPFGSIPRGLGFGVASAKSATGFPPPPPSPTPREYNMRRSASRSAGCSKTPLHVGEACCLVEVCIVFRPLQLWRNVFSSLLKERIIGRMRSISTHKARGTVFKALALKRSLRRKDSRDEITRGTRGPP